MASMNSVKSRSKSTPKPPKVQPSLEEILTRLRANLPDLRERYHIASLGVFGSYVRGEQRKRSDLDILVEFNVTPTLFKLAGLQRELTEISGIKVDLALRRTLKPDLQPYILPEVIYL
jgi:uncharacterized protein